jgi:hypothetical protein
VIKHAMELMELAAGPVRPPLSPLDAATATSVAAIIQGWSDDLRRQVATGVPADPRHRAGRPRTLEVETEVNMA